MPLDDSFLSKINSSEQSKQYTAGNQVLSQQGSIKRAGDDNEESRNDGSSKYRYIYLFLSLVCCIMCIVSVGYLTRVIRQRRMAR